MWDNESQVVHEALQHPCANLSLTSWHQPYRVSSGLESPEMAEELLSKGFYHPTPFLDMWAYGQVLLQLLYGKIPLEHQEAMTRASLEGPQVTLEYARSLYHLPVDQAYNTQACIHSKN